MSRLLPIFPLGTVLFPGATLNLHIFEERYRLMIGRCLEERSPFGVVLIREGDEVEEGRLDARPAEPYAIGTMARISADMRLDDGRYLLTALGTGRFRIEAITQRLPYMVAAVVELPESTPADVAVVADEVRATYDRYWQAVASATGVEVEAGELPRDPTRLGYYLADRLQVTMALKQHWLECDLVTRLREIAANLRAELALLPYGRRDTSEGPSGMGSLN
ncbi:MAG: LON peptidase substrate-binding domain-containing protein [Chloroflexaceae bacterium]